MNHPEEYKLNNPVWYAINETHKPYGIDYPNAHFYHPDYSSFGGFATFENAPFVLDNYAEKTNSFFIFGLVPSMSKTLEIKQELICHQMIVHKEISYPITETIIKLEVAQMQDLLGLVRMVYPEYFKEKTATLGNYYGIYKNNQLVAVTGERLQMNSFIEVSAVITHPNHTGRGYAKQLVAHTANTIFAQNKTPFLHVANTNHGAIGLYESLGFITRKRISIWSITKKT